MGGFDFKLGGWRFFGRFFSGRFLTAGGTAALALVIRAGKEEAQLGSQEKPHYNKFTEQLNERSNLEDTKSRVK